MKSSAEIGRLACTGDAMHGKPLLNRKVRKDLAVRIFDIEWWLDRSLRVIGMDGPLFRSTVAKSGSKL